MQSKQPKWLVTAAACALVASLLPLVITPTNSRAADTSRTFPETGQTVKDRFLQYWDQHGGLAQQGFPISGEMQEKSDTDGKTYTVQYFERAIFEMHTENPAPNDVLLSLLGVFLYQKKYPNGAPNQAVNADLNFRDFPETGHRVGGIFLQYWDQHGGLAQQGLPISDEFIEVSDLDHKSYTVQYFERAVFEYHREQQPPFQVLLSQLGKFRYDTKYASTGTMTPLPLTPIVIGFSTSTPTSTPTPIATRTPNVITQGVIAFSSGRTGNKDIWRIKGDGTQPTNLTPNSPRHDDYPSYSPDRTKIVFMSERDGNQEIYVMPANGSSTPTRLTDNPARDYDPSWSPDGTKIVFVSDRDGNPADIYTMNANGTGPMNITQSAGEDTSPSWGTTGRIVFASKRSGVNQIYTMNPDGTNPITQLTSTGENSLPKWSPTANRIVFVSERDGQNEIYIMGPGGQNQTRLTNNAAADWDPAFSPDGTRIVFSSYRAVANNLELYIMNVDGSNPQRMTTQNGIDTHPSWSIGP